MPSKSIRKRQSRLAFTPLPSSSPAAKDYHKQIRDRAAAVVIEGSPSSSKRRKMQTVAEEEETTTSAIPTPPDDEADDSDDQPLQPTQRRRRAKQQRLDFSSARDPSSFDTPMRLASSPRRTKSKAGMFGSSQTVGRSVEDSDSDESDVVMPRSQRGSRRKSVEEEPRRVTRSNNVEEDEESDSIAVGIAPPRKKATVVESDDDDEDMPTTLGKQKRQRKRRGSQGSFIDDSSPPMAEKRSSRGRKKAQEPRSTPPDSPPAAPDSDDDLIIVGEPSRKRRRRASSDEEEQEDEEEAPKTPKRRLKQRKITSQEKDDLEEDLEFFKPSSGEEDNVQQNRGTQSVKKNARQKALEQLKKKRTQSSQPQAGQSSQAPVVVDEDEDVAEEESDGLEMLDEEDEDDEVEAVPRPISYNDMMRETEEDAGFIEQANPDGILGAPDLAIGMPIEFTKYARMQPKELFKFAVEWFVQRKINPAFAREEELYQLTFRKLDDAVQGLSSSKFTSSAWVADFVTALQARPIIAYEHIDADSTALIGVDKCQACNRSGHPPTYKVQFQGRPYHRETLEEVPDEDDEEDSSDDDEGTNRADQTEWDFQGREVLPESHDFYLGKFCFANSRSAHNLYHWRYDLAGEVEEWLGEHGYLKDKEVVRRDKMSTRKRNKEANKIFDEMDARGKVKDLYKRFKENIDEARNSKQSGRW